MAGLELGLADPPAVPGSLQGWPFLVAFVASALTTSLSPLGAGGCGWRSSLGAQWSLASCVSLDRSPHLSPPLGAWAVHSGLLRSCLLFLPSLLPP